MPPLTYITTEWRPGDAVYQHLAQLNIPRDFIDDQVAEFILYWAERGQQNHSWGSKFAKHVVHEWRLHEIKSAQQRAVKPLTAMTSDWRPSNKAIEFLMMAGITKAFIDECIVSFVMYWQENGALHNTWNTKFVGHCQYHWKQQTKSVAVVHHNAAGANQSTRDRTLRDQLTDTSWANK